jgi:hypothetical protein
MAPAHIAPGDLLSEGATAGARVVTLRERSAA